MPIYVSLVDVIRRLVRRDAAVASEKPTATATVLFQYALAIVVPGLAFLLYELLTHWRGPGLPPFITFYPAIMVVALLGGFGPGLLATFLSAFAAAFWLMGHSSAAPFPNSIQSLSLVLFLGMGTFMSFVARLYHRARARAAVLEQQAALSQSEARLHAILESSPDPIFLKDTECRLVVANAATLAALGKPAAAVLGKAGEEFYADADTARTILATDRRIMASGQSEAVEETIPTPSGSRVFLSTKTPYRDAAGRVVGLIGVARDITERKAHEREIERLTRLYATLSQINQGIVHVKSQQELALEISRIAVKFGGFKLAWVGQHDAQACEVMPLGAAGEPQALVHTFRHQTAGQAEHPCLCSAAVRENRSCVVNDLSAAPELRALLSAVAQSGIRAAGTFPIRVRGAVWGIFGVYADEPGVFQDKEIALLEEAAMDIGYALENLENEAQRRQAEAATLASNERLKRVLGNIAQGYYALDCEWHVLAVNAAAEKHFGKPAAEILGRSFEEVTRGRIPDNVRAGIRQVMATGQPLSIEVASRVRPGTWAIDYIHPFGSGVEVYFTDITERKQNEILLQQLNRELRAITECNHALLRASDERQFLSEVCQIVCEVAGYRMAWVGYARKDAQKSVALMASAGAVDGYLDNVDVVCEDVPKGRGPTGTAIRTGELCYIDDFTTSPRMAPWREAALARGYHSSIALPLDDDTGTTFGALTLYSATANAFVAEEIKLLTELAGDLAFGVSMLRARAEHARSQAEVERMRHLLAEGQRIAQLGSWEYLAATRQTVWSDEQKRIYGLDPAGPSPDYQQMLRAYIHPEDAADLDRAFREALRQNAVFENENRIVRPDGSVRHIVNRAVPYLDKDGQLVRYVGATLDVTERKQQEDMAHRWQYVFEAAEFGLAYIRASDNTFVDVNEAFARQRGYTRQELIGAPVSKVHAPATHEAVRQRIAAVDQAGHLVFESVHQRKDGSSFPVLLEVTVIKDAQGRPTSRVAYTLDITERKEAEAAQRRLVTAIEQAAEAVVITNLHGTITYVNPAFEKVTGYTAGEALGRNPRILKSGKVDPHVYEAMWRTLAQGQTWKGHLINRKKNGAFFEEETTISPLRDQANQTIGYVALKYDVTKQSHLEASLRQAQKMEAIGQLAGGVAHDFNNMLAATMMNLSLLREKFEADPAAMEIFRDLNKGAKRAADLTRQLLMFSRRSVLETKPIDLNDLVRDLLKMLARLIGEHITIRSELQAAPAVVQADAGMLEQVLMNFTVNARDAMPQGGTLTIAIQSVELDAQRVEAHPEARPGRFCCLSVTDTGCGMDEATMQHIFEPFFTTKEVGKGTGLGLATVHGIVAQHKGWVEVESQPGRGSTFRVYLPGVSAAPESDTNFLLSLHRGTETILLVEDEGPLRRATTQALRRLGYSVYDADNGPAALQLWAAHKHEVKLLLSDMIMPGGMTGLELAAQLRQERPELKIILTSGYHPEMSQSEKVTASGMTFFRKPYQIGQLSALLRQCLDESTS